jgi:hypothetical protein
MSPAPGSMQRTTYCRIEPRSSTSAPSRADADRIVTQLAHATPRSSQRSAAVQRPAARSLHEAAEGSHRQLDRPASDVIAPRPQAGPPRPRLHQPHLHPPPAREVRRRPSSPAPKLHEPSHERRPAGSTSPSACTSRARRCSARTRSGSVQLDGAAARSATGDRPSSSRVRSSQISAAASTIRDVGGAMIWSEASGDSARPPRGIWLHHPLRKDHSDEASLGRIDLRCRVCAGPP